jgi:aconitate hydratase 2/2-methylisocitrate dehydratase
MIDAYLQHVNERAAVGVPPLPLTSVQADDVMKLLQDPPAEHRDLLLELLAERIAPGVDPAAKVKADFLGAVARGEKTSPLVSPERAVELLGTMLGGYNVTHLIDLLQHESLADAAADALERTLFVFDGFDAVRDLAEGGNAAAQRVLKSWAEAEWFTRRPEVPESVRVVVFKVEGEINTDDFSPAKHATTRPDIPVHALAMGESRFPGRLDEIAAHRAAGKAVAFVGDVVGTGSSRKSACNSLIWHIGEDIPAVPNKRTGGVILGGVIAPIFFNTAEDSGALPIQCDVSAIANGQEVDIRPHEGRILDVATGGEVATFDLRPATLLDEFRAGGRVPLIIGKQLTQRAREALDLPAIELFAVPPVVQLEGQGYSLAQKMVGRACDVEGVHPGTACLPKMTSVGSQDTTGPMTRDELKELACLRLLRRPGDAELLPHRRLPEAGGHRTQHTLPDFIQTRGGVSLQTRRRHHPLLAQSHAAARPGGHRRRLPHPLPARHLLPGGLRAGGLRRALGVIPLDMPESVLVKFTGEMQPGITLRDLVNAIPYEGDPAGLLTVPKQGKKNVFNGRILEMEGLPNLPSSRPSS